MERKKRAILVVDSSASFVFYTAMMLKKLEYTVRTASTAEDALRIAADSAPALVITDAVLQKTSGVELLKQMKGSAGLGFIPVIMHTAQRDLAVKEACTAAGCAAFFFKPADPEALYRAIQAATESTPRQNIRIDVALTARIGEAGGGRVRTEAVTTLSEGGLYISSPAPEPVDDVLPVTLLLGSREIRTRSLVLYSSATVQGPHRVPGMGMRFVTIAPEDRMFVREYIREQVLKDLSSGKR